MKTHNLTRSRAQNDPNNHRIQGISFRNFENQFWRSRCDVFLFFQLILDFKHSSDVEMSVEELEIIRLSNCGVQKIRFAKKSMNSQMCHFDLING